MSDEIVREMTREELLEEIQKLKNEIAAMKEWERSLENSRNFREGQIEGLKFARGQCEMSDLTIICLVIIGMCTVINIISFVIRWRK